MYKYVKESFDKRNQLEYQLSSRRQTDDALEERQKTSEKLNSQSRTQLYGSINVFLQDICEIRENVSQNNFIYGNQAMNLVNNIQTGMPEAATASVWTSERDAFLIKKPQEKFGKVDQLFESRNQYEDLCIPRFEGTHSSETITERYLTPRLEELGVIEDNFMDIRSVTLCSERLFAVCDQKQHRITVFYHNDNMFTKSMNILLTPSNPNSPQSIAVMNDGSYAVARKTCVEIYSSLGWYEKVVETHGGRNDKTNGIRSVAVTKTNLLLIGDAKRMEITEYDPQMRTMRVIKTLIRPLYLTVISGDDDHGGRVVISDSKIGKVQILDLTAPGTHAKIVTTIDVLEARGVLYDCKSRCLLVTRSMRTSKNVPELVKSNSGEITQYCCATGRCLGHLAERLYFPCEFAMIKEGVLAVTDMKKLVLYKLSH